MSILIIASRFNEMITSALLHGAQETLATCGFSEKEIESVWVPGAFEIPLAATIAAETGRYAAIICLGCVIRGETPHFDYVAGQAAAGVMRAGMDAKIPIIFGVLTTETVDQALNRSGLKSGNKGRESAMAAVEMLRTLGCLREGKETNLR